MLFNLPSITLKLFPCSLVPRFLSDQRRHISRSILLLFAMCHFNAIASTPIPFSAKKSGETSANYEHTNSSMALAPVYMLERLHNTSQLSKQSNINAISEFGEKANSEPNQHVIEIGFFYTEDLLAQIGRAEIDRYIDEQISAANQVMINSGLAIRRQVSYVGPFPMANEPDTAINLFLANVYSDQAFSALSNIRERFGLDYLTILRPQTDNNFCGWAYYDNPYAIMEVGGFCTSATLGAHEWGHNDGADHDIANSSDTPVRTDARGYNCAGEGTIMSTSNNWNTRHNIYSSPDISVNGEACGKVGEADFISVLNELVTLPNHLGNKQAASEKIASVAVSTDKLSIAEGESVTVTLTLVDGDNNVITLDRDVSVELYTYGDAGSDGDIRFNGALADVDFINATQRISFSAGQSTQSITVITLGDNEQEPTELLQIGARYGDYVNGSANELTVEINDAAGQENLSFSLESVELESNQSIALTVNRAADFDIPVLLALAFDSEYLTITPEIMEFTSANASENVTITAGNINTAETVMLRLEAIDGSQVFDQLAIQLSPVVIEPEKSSGGGVNFWLALLAVLAFATRELTRNRRES